MDVRIADKPHYSIRPVEAGLTRQEWFDRSKEAKAWVVANRYQTYWSGIASEAKAEAAAKRATEKSGIPFKVHKQYAISLF